MASQKCVGPQNPEPQSESRLHVLSKEHSWQDPTNRTATVAHMSLRIHKSSSVNFAPSTIPHCQLIAVHPANQDGAQRFREPFFAGSGSTDSMLLKAASMSS